MKNLFLDSKEIQIKHICELITDKMSKYNYLSDDKMMNKVNGKDIRKYNLMIHILEEEIVHDNKMMQFLGE